MPPSNSWEEMRHKTLLYLAAGASDHAGELHVFDGSGERDESSLVPAIPKQVG